MAEWYDDDESSIELLKFISEMKVNSEKKSNQVNSLLTTFSNSTEPTHKANTSYDELMLFEEILTTKVNKMITNLSTDTNSSQTKKIITENLSQTETKNSENEASAETEKKLPNFEEKSIEIAEEDVKKLFDPQRLIERVRKSYNGMQTTPNYDMLTCKSQSFIQRLAVLGEMLT